MMTKKEAKKQGLAFWDEGSFVEIGILIKKVDKKGEYSDPNSYRARCLCSGTRDRVRVEVLDGEGCPHPDFAAALLPGEFFVWRLLPAEDKPPAPVKVEFSL